MMDPPHSRGVASCLFLLFTYMWELLDRNITTINPPFGHIIQCWAYLRSARRHTARAKWRVELDFPPDWKKKRNRNTCIYIHASGNGLNCLNQWLPFSDYHLWTPVDGALQPFSSSANYYMYNISLFCWQWSHVLLMFYITILQVLPLFNCANVLC